MDIQEFRPFINPTNSTYVKLPDFDTLISNTLPKSSKKKISQINNGQVKEVKEVKGVKVDLSNMGIDFEKLKQSKGKRGYTLPELNKFVEEINRRGTIIKRNQRKDKIVEIIYNLQ